MVKDNKLMGMLLGSFAADAFALGPHWIYDTEKIDDIFGDINTITNPPKESFHPTKEKGDFTHYGDQSLLLLKFLKNHKEFSIQEIKEAWLKYMESYKGYKDHATKESIERLRNSETLEGSSSDELGGAARMAPIIFEFYPDKDKIIKYVAAETKLTHNNPLVIHMVEFIAKITFKVLEGSSPEEAVLSEKDKAPNSLKNMIDDALENLQNEPRDVIKNFGQSCGGTHAFPSTIYLLVKYQDSFEKALKHNVLSGGDSAARGMILGMILGAYKGQEGIPESWLKDMKAYEEIIS